MNSREMDDQKSTNFVILTNLMLHLSVTFGYVGEKKKRKKLLPRKTCFLNFLRDLKRLDDELC